MSGIDVKAFVDKQVEAIREALGDERALIAVSGGVDSTVSAVLTHLAIGDNLVCVFIDDNFMRIGEPEKVKQLLSASPLNLPVKVLDERTRFMDALDILIDAEDKRKAFRETFYKTLSDAARREGCGYLVQGTIKADIDETKGGIKTQHNILEQIGIDPVERFGYRVVEPVASLYKYQVREVARYLGASSEVSERQPFPGPGLSVRVVGALTQDKLEQLKAATAVVEDAFAELKPAQYFTAIMSGRTMDVPQALVKEVAEAIGIEETQVAAEYLSEKATGMVEGKRTYGLVAAMEIKNGEGKSLELSYEALEGMRHTVQSDHPEISRMLYLVAERGDDEGYYISMRAVETRDFLTAEISQIPWKTLRIAAKEILSSCPKVIKVYYDITPKPPATVEFE
ncbi:MAG: GMP synthase [Candidatus Bathyarchaeota archaeon]|nr:MAG: GMP synthase [Candidatus Bathyarchaeota archaeon]